MADRQSVEKPLWGMAADVMFLTHHLCDREDRQEHELLLEMERRVVEAHKQGTERMCSAPDERFDQTVIQMPSGLSLNKRVRLQQRMAEHYFHL